MTITTETTVAVPRGLALYRVHQCINNGFSKSQWDRKLSEMSRRQYNETAAQLLALPDHADAGRLLFSRLSNGRAEIMTPEQWADQASLDDQQEWAEIAARFYASVDV
jgi:hypothetical protein